MPPRSSEQFVCHDNNVFVVQSIMRPAETRTVKRRLLSMATPVSFSNEVTMQKFHKVEDSKAVWYSSDEYSKMKKSMEKSIKKMEEGKLIESNKESAAGLFELSRQGLRTKSRRQQDAQQAVFREQSYQRKKGMRDGSRIAEVYSDISSSCLTDAVMTAMRMETAVKRDQSQSSSSLKGDNHKKSSTTFEFIHSMIGGHGKQRRSVQARSA